MKETKVARICSPAPSLLLQGSAVMEEMMDESEFHWLAGLEDELSMEELLQGSAVMEEMMDESEFHWPAGLEDELSMEELLQGWDVLLPVTSPLQGRSEQESDASDGKAFYCYKPLVASSCRAENFCVLSVSLIFLSSTHRLHRTRLIDEIIKWTTDCEDKGCSCS